MTNKEESTVEVSLEFLDGRPVVMLPDGDGKYSMAWKTATRKCWIV